ncbi:probable G-protein coupled receptor No18 [Ptychodera flava]|uniref:probable G-protein coupled receptor No18 n=1 Tax=Ptychodera flava TaxID=63121 RepID=UPI00396AAE27
MVPLNNTTLDVGILTPLPEAVVAGTLFSALIVATAFGNLLVITSVLTQRSLQVVQNYFIVSLAVADLLVAIYIMPLSTINYLYGYWIFSYSLCDIWLTSDVFLCTASILNLCAIALDRYWAITDPISYAAKRTKKRVLVIIAFVWGLSALVSMPPLVGWNDHTRVYNILPWQRLCLLTSEKGYVIYSALGSFYVPFVVMAVVYFRIYKAARLRLRKRRNASTATFTSQPTHFKPSSSSDSNLHDGSSRNASAIGPPSVTVTANSSVKDMIDQMREEKQRISVSKERKAARTLGIIMGGFVLCWLPFFIMYIILPFCSTCTLNKHAEAFIIWIGYANSCCNPVIYTIFNKEFRSAFTRMLCGRCKMRSVALRYR